MLPFGPAELDDEVTALDVTVIAKTRAQRFHPAGIFRSGGDAEEPDPDDLCRWLLSESGEGPRELAQAKRKQQCPPRRHTARTWRSPACASRRTRSSPLSPRTIAGARRRCVPTPAS